MQLPYKEYIVYCSNNYVLYYDVHNQALDPIYMVLTKIKECIFFRKKTPLSGDLENQKYYKE